MRILGRDIIEKFKKRHPQSRHPLDDWTVLIEKIDCANFPELMRIFNSVDYVKPDTIFDISGNKYRLISQVDYRLQAVAVKKVMTHEEYDRWSH